MCWDPIPANRPSIGVIYTMLNILYSLLEVGIEFMEMKFKNPNIFSSPLTTENFRSGLNIMRAINDDVLKSFSKEREDKWRLQLAKLEKSPSSMKSKNIFTSKLLYFLNSEDFGKKNSS
ncbi:8308_t:CDS:2 [Gigaspora margarita]|uniref:8308_t:CDS:1 n=1 Tax=Gigaspora margarita TaxID=4874 RepID=A0ABN7UVM0_GIGMA|nr:8308_t:CDS:2 [Gigaspora margarita]